MDIKDKKLLYEIDLNARLGTSALGKKIGLSQENTHYRLKRLEDKGIISGYITLLNFGKLGYTGYGVYSRFQNVTQEQKQKIIKELKKHDHIYWIASFAGKYDLAFAIMAKNIIHFNEIFSKLSTKYNDVLKDFTTAIRVELTQFPRNYLLDKNTARSPHFGKFIEAVEISPLDKNILSSISSNARISILKLGQELSKPASTISFRLKQLERKEIIQGYSAKIHCQNFGYQSYQLFVNTHNMTLTQKKKLFTYCSNHKNIVFFIETVGKWNYEIIYEIKDQKQLQDLIIDLRTKFTDVIVDVESSILFDHYVKYNQYPLNST
jgi:Lrp/AsnC family transcriptional regulator, leucine-responsive regulatory protein